MQPPYYIVMDYAEGQDLRAWCEAQGGLEKVPLAMRLEIVAQVADGLQAAHERRGNPPGREAVEHFNCGMRSAECGIADRGR